MRKTAGLALIGLICFAWALLAEAQTLSVVRGRVLNNRGIPVIRVKVTVAMKWGFTDSTGRYVLSRLPPGKYKVTLERNGKTVTSREIEVKGAVTDVPDLKWPF